MLLYDTDFYIRLIELLALVSVTINCLEVIFTYQNYAEGGIFDWNVLKYNQKDNFDGIKGKVLQLIYAFPNYIVLVFLMLTLSIASIIILLYSNLPITINLFLTAFILISHYRSGYGMDGADQLTGIILVSILLGQIGNNEITKIASISFIGLQSILSYFTAGYFKLVSPVWRDGTGLWGILNSKSYGIKGLSSFLKNRFKLTIFLSWSIILFETLFPISITYGTYTVIPFIILGIIFHLFNALIMGLNNFFWTFIATYPAVFFIAIQIHKLINSI